MSDTQYIAQSFLINMKESFKISTSGYFVSAVDLFFSEKDRNLPVTVEIREVDPTSNLLTNKYLPFSRVYQQSNNINVSTDGSKPTPFIFESPIYLQDNREYAIVITPGGGSPNYRVWTSRLGGEDKITKNRVTEQPAVGMLYASGVPVPEEDLKFRLYIADFDKSTSGTVVVKNEPKDYFTIANSAGGRLNKVGETVHGPSRVVGSFSNTVDFSTSIANGSIYAQGITSGAKGTLTTFNGSYIIVKDVTIAAKFQSAESINIRTNVGVGGISSGTGTILASGSITSVTTPVGTVSYYDEVNSANVYLHIANCSYVSSGTACTYNRMFTPDTYIKGQTDGYTTRIVSINNLQYDLANFQSRVLQPSNTTIYAEGKFATSASTRDSSFIRINMNDDTEFASPRYVLSRSNESNTSSSAASVAVNRSTELKYVLTSNNRFASPAIDLRQIHGTTVLNLINSNTDIGSSEDFVISGGNAKTRYITRKVVLADGQDAEDLRVYLTAYKPSGSDIFVYYKILHAEDNDTFEQTRWVPMNRVVSEGFTSSAIYSSSSNRNDFLELVYDIPTFPTSLSGTVYDPVGSILTGTVSTSAGSNTITGSSTSFNTQLSVGNVIRISGLSGTYRIHNIGGATSMTVTSQPASSVSNKDAFQVFAINQSGSNTTNSKIIEYRNSARARFVGFKYFAIKIVLVNQNSSNPPRIRDLRAIALQR